MTRSPLDALRSESLMGAQGTRGACGNCEAPDGPPSTREQWKFKGRETLWGGYEFLVWTRQDGKRFTRCVK